MTFDNYDRLFAATIGRASNPDPKGTFKKWHLDVCAIRDAVLKVTEMYEAEKVKVMKEYSKSKASELLAEMQNKYVAMRNEAKRTAKERLDAVLASKRAEVLRHCAAPSDDDIRLLTALKMRSKLSESDIVHAAEQLGSNYVSLGTLADIAAAHEIDIPLRTAEMAEEEINDAERLGEDMIRALDTPAGQLNYNAFAFYNHPDAASPVTDLFNALDADVFSSEQLKPKIEPKLIDSSDFVQGVGEASEVTLREGNGLASVMLQFGVTSIAAVEKVNPGVDLENLHAGDHVIIPSARMKMYNGRSFVQPDQVTPVHVVKEEKADGGAK